MATEPAAPREVIVYTTPLCPPCERLKAYLRSRGVEFRVADLLMEPEAAQELELRNIRTSPVLRVDGEILAGTELKTENIDALLGLD